MSRSLPNPSLRRGGAAVRGHPRANTIRQPKCDGSSQFPLQQREVLWAAIFGPPPSIASVAPLTQHEKSESCLTRKI